MNNQKTALDSVQKKNALKKDAEIFSLGINIQNSLLRLTTIGILLAIPFIASADNFSMLDMNNEITSTLQAGTPHPIDTAPNNEDYNGSIVIHERAMSKLLNNQYTRKAITEWTDEDAIKQYAKILEKYGDQIKPNKLHKALSSPQIENLMKNLDELDNLNIENFDDWRRIVVQSNNPATILEADFAVLLKNKGHTVTSSHA